MHDYLQELILWSTIGRDGHHSERKERILNSKLDDLLIKGLDFISRMPIEQDKIILTTIEFCTDLNKLARVNKDSKFRLIFMCLAACPDFQLSMASYHFQSRPDGSVLYIPPLMNPKRLKRFLEDYNNIALAHALGRPLVDKITGIPVVPVFKSLPEFISAVKVLYLTGVYPDLKGVVVTEELIQPPLPGSLILIPAAASNSTTKHTAHNTTQNKPSTK